MAATIRIKRVTIKDVKTDEHYARRMNTVRVNRIASKFDSKGLGVIVVNERRNGDLIVIDGNHRVAALKQMKRNETVVDAVVFTGLSMEEEANLFATLNNQLPVHGADRFRALVVGGDKQANEISSILRKNKLTVAKGQGVPTGYLGVQGVERLYRIHNSGVLEEVADVVAKAFHDQLGALGSANKVSIPSQLMMTVAEMFKRWPNLEKPRLVETLSSRTPKEWVNNARAVAQQAATNQTGKVGLEILVRAYNHGRQMKNRLRLPARWKPVVGA